MKSALLLLLCVAKILGQTAPQWPNVYYVEGTFSIPYFNIVEDLKLNFDGANNRQRFDYYDGMDTYLYRLDLGNLYEIVPRIDQKVCFVQNITGSSLVALLPDMSSWTFQGTHTVGGVLCNNWEQTVKNLNTTAVYNMYVNAEDGTPVQLYLAGYDFVFGSHPDIYIMDYKVYKPNWVNETAFQTPSLCGNAQVMSTRHSHRVQSVLGLVSILIPPSQSADEFQMWAKMNHKVYSTPEEEQLRRNTWLNNKRFIESHNDKVGSHKLRMNKFGDWSADEFKEIMLPKRGQLRPVMAQNPPVHQMSGKQLPSYINWVEIGAVNPPKDQGVCGSCWTFGTAGSLEGAWFIANGELVSLSEQQIVDCAWVNWGGGGGNSGCDGGFAAPAFWWIQQNGGIALESSYKYLMQDGFCNPSDTSSGVKVQGYVNVTAFSEEALQDAVANYGPIAVAIDASHSDFTYYTSGVYYNPDCKSDLNDLDHEVLVVGYGTTDEGEDYWLVKNSWSTHWGDEGYVKMARNRGNACGIASQATYAIV